MKVQYLITTIFFFLITIVQAQIDTISISYRDRNVIITSDSLGMGKKVITFDDGLYQSKVIVLFRDSFSGLQKVQDSEKFIVRTHPLSKVNNIHKVHQTLNFRFGLITFANVIPQSSLDVLPYTNGHFPREHIKNNILESKYHAINWGLNIPTKKKWLSINTGLGVSSQKITRNDARFRLRSNSTGYTHYHSNLEDPIISDFKNFNYFLHTTAVNLPFDLKFMLRKKQRFLSIGINNRLQFRATQSISENMEYSYLGLVYKGNTWGDNLVNKNFHKYQLDGTITYGRGFFSLFFMSNLTPMFKQDFYRKEQENNTSKTRTFLPLSFRYGIQINVW